MAMIAAFLFGISGGALGGFAVSALMQQHRRGDRPRTHRVMRFEFGGPMARDLEERLDLTPVQRERVRAILRDSGPRYAAVRESTRAALERELTPEQRVQFRQMEHRFVRHRMREGREGRFPPWQDRRSHWEIDTIIEGESR